MTMSFSQSINKDILWKLFSFALAGVIWGVVDRITSTRQTPIENPLSPRVERTFTRLPVLVVSSAEDVRECKVNPDNVTVTIRGARENMDKVSALDIKVHVDLTDIAAARSLRKRVIV